ncbi:pol protein [Cucumis melo var. makuwa]|uniref:Pol protein n=1 Tax=Cucumis melo var. makuwa TaxID=1194695 RepID=A0A5A7V566_CUCMM|nr:pol protein [Cucumis melo var. makuwa]
MLGVLAGEGTKIEASRLVTTLEFPRLEMGELTKSTYIILGKSTYTPNCPGQEVRFQHSISPSDRWSHRTFKPNLGRYAASFYQATIRMTSFEALYGRCCRSPVCWGEVAPMKGVLRFEKKGKLSPRFVGSFEILERIGLVTYRLALPPSFSAVRDVFHVSMLRKEVKMLRNRGIILVKVLWRNHEVEEATWKREDNMRAQYPEFFKD